MRPTPPSGKSSAGWSGRRTARAPCRAGCRARTALRRRLDKLRALGPDYAGLEPSSAHDRLAPLESLRRLRATLAGKVRATLRPADQGRLREWGA